MRRKWKRIWDPKYGKRDGAMYLGPVTYSANDMPEFCCGADDPEERCPRGPNECCCWNFSEADRRKILNGTA